jgi:hypothetical protein
MKKATEESMLLNLCKELHELLYSIMIKSEPVRITAHRLDMIIIKLETTIVFQQQLKDINNFMREYSIKHDILINFSIELRDNSLCLVIF